MVRYTEAAAGSTVAQAWLTNYNRGDVEATLVIGYSAASGRADQAGSPVGHFGLGPSQSGVGPTTAGRFFAHSISHDRGVPLPAHETRGSWGGCEWFEVFDCSPSGAVGLCCVCGGSCG